MLVFDSQQVVAVGHMVIHQHGAGEGACGGELQASNGDVGAHQVGIEVGRAFHAALEEAFGPLLARSGVAAALPGAANLQAHGLDGREGQLHVEAPHLGAVGVAALVVHIAAGGVVEEQLVDEGVVDAGVESLHQQVGLEQAEVEAEVERGIGRMGALHAQVGSVGYLVQLAVHRAHMQVLVVDLRGTEPRGVARTQGEVVGGGIAQVEPRVGYGRGNHRVLVHPGAGQDAPAGVFPLVLQVGAEDAYLLAQGVGAVEGVVVQAVEGVLHPGGELGRHEPQPVEMAAIESPVVERQVLRIAVGGA